MYDLIFNDQNLGDTGSPKYFDLSEHLVPISAMDKREVKPSGMFTIKLELGEFMQEYPDRNVYDASQGDGGFSLGGIPPEELAEALLRYLPQDRSTKYGNPIGREDVREAVFHNYYDFDSLTGLTPDNIIFGDGGRDLLQKWYQLIVSNSNRCGDIVLVSAAPWGSYAQGTYINGINTLMAPGTPENGFKFTTEAIDVSLEFALADNRRISGIVFTSPDNPTGNYSSYDELINLIEYSVKKGITHIFVDLIYQVITDPEVGCYDVNKLYNALSKEAKQSVVFMDGLTKAAGGSNLRNAHMVVGNDHWVHLLKGLATHTVFPNALGEAAALEIYGQENPIDHPWVKRVTGPTAKSRAFVRERFQKLGYKFICDQGYYAFINIWPYLRKEIPEGITIADGQGGQKNRIDTAEDLKTYLTTKCGVAIIHGTIFKQPHFIRFSYANDPVYTESAIQRLHDSVTALE